MSRPRIGQAVRTYAQHFQNERQVLTVSGVPTSGTWILTFDGQATDPLDFNCTALDVQEELNALSNVAHDGVVCYGGPINSSPIHVVFLGDVVGYRNVPLMTVTDTFDVGGVGVTVADAGGLVDPGTVTATITHSGGSTVTGTVNDLGGGVTGVDWTPDKAGVWTVRITGDSPVAHVTQARVAVDP